MKLTWFFTFSQVPKPFWIAAVKLTNFVNFNLLLLGKAATGSRDPAAVSKPRKSSSAPVLGYIIASYLKYLLFHSLCIVMFCLLFWLFYIEQVFCLTIHNDPNNFCKLFQLIYRPATCVWVVQIIPSNVENFAFVNTEFHQPVCCTFIYH